MEYIQEMDKAMRAFEEQNQEEEEQTNPIYGDVLESVLSFVPLTDLLPICRVSRSWRRAVFSSLTNFNKVKPWLFVTTQSTRSFETKVSVAYDPRSDDWIEIGRPTVKYVSALKSFGSDLRYVLSSAKLVFSEDPFELAWREIDAPRICRSDPIVAVCGTRVVVAGSCWQFEDDLMAVEVYDFDSSTWRTCDSMPEILKDVAAATWLSVAADETEMFVTEKASGITYSFDPITGAWSAPYNLRPDPRVYFTAIGFSGEDLIIAGIIGTCSKPEGVGIWKVERRTRRCSPVPIGVSPAPILAKLKGENDRSDLRQIEISAARGFVYVYNPSEPAEVVFCEFGGGDCVWGSTRNVAWSLDVRIGGKMVFNCGRVEIEDLQEAVRSGNRKFEVSSRRQ